VTERRALLVDYGGVLTGNVFDSFRAFAVAHDLAPDAVTELFLGDPDALEELHELELGRLSESEFEPRLAARLGVATDGLIDRLFAGAAADEAMRRAVAAVRAAGTPTALVSNSWGLGIYDRAGGVLDLFDAVVLSGEVGLRKPRPEIFLLAAERLGVRPADCVFVDDLRTNVAAAAELGMATVLHRGAEKSIPELERLLGVALPRPQLLP
jgi:epoxide hydrolase-like predicted phosphatase